MGAKEREVRKGADNAKRQVCEPLREQWSPGAKVAARERQKAERTRIAARENRCPRGLLPARIAEGTTVAAASVGVREGTESLHVVT